MSRGRKSRRRRRGEKRKASTSSCVGNLATFSDLQGKRNILLEGDDVLL